jgi:hypothetical protein
LVLSIPQGRQKGNRPMGRSDDLVGLFIDFTGYGTPGRLQRIGRIDPPVD